jgi:hypothetical protein
MDISAPLSILLEQGTGYVLFVLSCLVIWWMQRRYDKLLEKYDQKSEHIYDQVVTFKDTYYKSMTDQTDTQRLMTEKLSSMAESMKTIAGGMYQTFYSKTGRPDA